MKRHIFAQPAPTSNDSSIFEKYDEARKKYKDTKEKVKDVRKDFTEEMPGGTSPIDIETIFNELANTFKQFGITEAKYTDPKQLRRWLVSTPMGRQLEKIPKLVKAMKDTLIALHPLKDTEPNISQLFVNFVIQYLDRKRNLDSVTEKIIDLKEKATDMEDPKDIYVIEFLKGNYGQAALALLFSNFGKQPSNKVIQDINETANTAVSMFGTKSPELLRAQYLDNAQAQANAAMLDKSLAQFQALVDMGVQKAKWRAQLDNFTKDYLYDNPIARSFWSSTIVSALGAAFGGFEKYERSFQAPLQEVFKEAK